VNRRLSVYRPASSNLIQALPKSGLPEAHQRVIREYCSSKIAEMERELIEYGVSEEEFRRRMLLRAQEEFDKRRLLRQQPADRPL